MRKRTSHVMAVLLLVVIAGCANEGAPPASDSAPASFEGPAVEVAAKESAPPADEPAAPTPAESETKREVKRDSIEILPPTGGEGLTKPAEPTKRRRAEPSKRRRAEPSGKTKGSKRKEKKSTQEASGFAAPKSKKVVTPSDERGGAPSLTLGGAGRVAYLEDDDNSVRIGEFADDDGVPQFEKTTTRLRRKQKKLNERQLVKPAPPVIIEEQLDGFENQVIEATTIARNQAIDTRVDPQSTFSIDVDTGGYTLARARLRDGYRPKREDVRIEEFLNYFHYDYAAPVDAVFSINMESAPNPFSPRGNEHLLRIGVQGKEVPDDARPPAHLTFLVDASGSMFGPDRLGLVIEALDLVTRNLRQDDTIAVVTYAMGADVQLWPAGAKERDLAAAAIAGLEPGGSSDLDEGLALAYEVAATHFTAGHINRVVLLGDGRANVGRTQPEELLESVRSSVEDGVTLSTIGFGAKSFNDRLMEQLADRGNGNYFFIDSYHEAQRVFRDRLCGTIFAIANDVKIQVEFNPKSVKSHRLLGYENRKLEHQQFRDDKVDAGEIGAGHSVTAIYAIELQPTLDETIASVGVRYKDPGQSEASELSFQLFSRELRKDVREASPDFKFAAAVALFAEVARGDVPGTADRMSLIREIAGEGIRRGEQPDREEFVQLVAVAEPFYAR